MNIHNAQILILHFKLLISLSLLTMNSFAAEAPGTGTFTEEQFEKGAQLYSRDCAVCHGNDLEGGAARALVGPSFRKTWSNFGVNVADLFTVISTTMPPRMEGNLDESENLDVLAFILGSNSVLQGSESIRNDYAYLAGIPISRADDALDSTT